jgi:hypothetical protein
MQAELEEPGFDLFGKNDWISPERIARAGHNWVQVARIGVLDILTTISGRPILRVCHPIRLSRGPHQ